MLKDIPAGHIRLFRREIIDLMDHEDYENLLKFTSKHNLNYFILYKIINSDKLLK